ncbi:hypothetical protein ILUMI_17318 [Ignelater luminosus]|uniref:J domain-containing protein n=1 Tax=Ignelater luminosus TaxID=2038154 RepID=A0A8K0G205_IGNLU|nr:hypothetical protein ILUMI_17318 [Ignelater luminosus]
MDMNKDEAERCIELAKQFIKARDRKKAERYLQKAEHLYSTQKAKDLLIEAQIIPLISVEDQVPEESKQLLYTDDQREAVKRIQNCTNYYEVLQINKYASYSDIKKAYKKLALRLHPDKNKCPGAAEAFNDLGNAVATLTDPEKRKQHDLFILDKQLFGNQKRLAGKKKFKDYNHHYYSTTCNNDVKSPATLEELLNSLFKDGFGNSSASSTCSDQVYENNLNPDDQKRQGIFAKLLQVLQIRRIHVHNLKVTSSKVKEIKRRSGKLYKTRSKK